MSLALNPLYKDMVRGFSTTTDDGRFKADWIRAANNTFDDLSNAAKMSTAISHIAKETDSTSDLDPAHAMIMFDGLVFHLVSMGYEHVRGDLAFAASQTNWNARKGEWMIIKSLEDQATQDDDGIATSDITGLGYLGSS